MLLLLYDSAYLLQAIELLLLGSCLAVGDQQGELQHCVAAAAAAADRFVAAALRG